MAHVAKHQNTNHQIQQKQHGKLTPRQSREIDLTSIQNQTPSPKLPPPKSKQQQATNDVEDHHPCCDQQPP
jgi:hypothetical protein